MTDQVYYLDGGPEISFDGMRLDCQKAVGIQKLISAVLQEVLMCQM